MNDLTIAAPMRDGLLDEALLASFEIWTCWQIVSALEGAVEADDIFLVGFDSR